MLQNWIKANFNRIEILEVLFFFFDSQLIFDHSLLISSTFFLYKRIISFFKLNTLIRNCTFYIFAGWFLYGTRKVEDKTFN